MSQHAPPPFVKTAAKAVTGALVAGLAALGQALTSPGVTASEWVVVALAALTGGAGVYVVPNASAADAPAGGAL